MLSRHTTPFDLFDRLEQQLSQAERVPAAEVLETDAGFSISIEMPGIDRQSIDVKATDRSLSVNAERPRPQGNESDVQPQLSEFRYGTWSRSFRFPRGIQRDGLKAQYRDGMLLITAPKAESNAAVSVAVEG
ncbi:MAG: Hsp20/alpha crystallin family protein [Synechococcus sp. MED-G71]|nr:MAG: Hsp20/alpha crystallin family protein [Synechococcus sp. MED-G71]RPF77791.1 MAG: Hsp20/alpha crystallin family protein [Synechococcus sp. TMED155]